MTCRIQDARVVLTRGGLWTLTAEDNHVRDGPERGTSGRWFSSALDSRARGARRARSAPVHSAAQALPPSGDFRFGRTKKASAAVAASVLTGAVATQLPGR